MKSKHILRLMSLFMLLGLFISINRPVHASISLGDKLDNQNVNPKSPQFQDTMQAQPTISMAITPQSIAVGGTAMVAVNLINAPAEGYSSMELTCTYYPDLLEVGNIVVADLFGAGPVVAIQGPQYDRFIVAIAGRHGNKATNSGVIMTFHVRGLQAGQSPIECQARVSQGNNMLTSLPPSSSTLVILINTSTPTIPPTLCDKAQFIADITVPNGTPFPPGAQFIKTWRLKNVGSCSWTTSYRVQLIAGEQMNAPFSMRLPVNVAPGETFDISLYMTAPSTMGSHRGYWILYNETGHGFGIGLQGNQPWSVDIVVSNATPSPTPSVTPGGPTDSPTPTLTSAPTATPRSGTYFDFVAQAYTATWSNAEGQLPYPGLDGDPNGFAFKVDNPRLETGAVDTRPGLLMVPQMTSPQNAFNLYVQGSYPPIHVQRGDRFQSLVGCEGGATNCYVGFGLIYQVDGEYPYHPQVFWGPFLERYDGQTSLVNIDLSPLAGKDVKFILTVFAADAATRGRALWVAPIIYRPNPAWTPTPSATPAADWLTFTNRRYGFAFEYPPPGPITAANDTFATIHLPFVQGTVLQAKSLTVSALENVNPCMGGPWTQTSENVTINGVPFLKETGQDRGTTYLLRWTSYSTARNNICVSLKFILYSLNPGQPATPPAIYDEAAESAIFEQIVGTYQWLEVTPTITPEEPPIDTPTPVFTLTPFNSPTSDPQVFGVLTGQVLAGKQVNISLFDTNQRLVISVNANNDGSYSITAPAGGTYTVIATAKGYLNAQGFATVTTNTTTTMPPITLIAGDIDNNNVIDQFDAMTIGMNYNSSSPAAADLNDDGIINVLDLEALALNYRKTGPVIWE